MTREQFMAKLRAREGGVEFGKDAFLWIPLIPPDSNRLFEAIEDALLWALGEGEDIQAGIQRGTLERVSGQPRPTGTLYWHLVTDRALLRVDIEGGTAEQVNQVRVCRTPIADVEIATVRRIDVTAPRYEVTLTIKGEDPLVLSPETHVVTIGIRRDRDLALLHFLTKLREVTHAARER